MNLTSPFFVRGYVEQSVEFQRLLAINVLARLNRRYRRFQMKTARSGDGNNIDVIAR